jgi:thiol:disulfide interchange protein DsbC
MKSRKVLMLIFALLPFGIFADGHETGIQEMLTPEAAKQKLLDSRPGLPVASIKPSMLEGYFEVRLAGGMTLYMNGTAEHFFAGDLFYVAPEGLVNATEKSRTDVRKKLLESLDESEMIVFAPPPERIKATVTVFTDIDCGYCRKLHLEVPELNRLGIAVRYLAYPRAGIGSPSYDKAVSAWCADNPQVALTKVKAGKEIEQLTCANPVATQYALGDEFGVSGTPAVVYENGFLQAGYLPAADMAERLGVK